MSRNPAQRYLSFAIVVVAGVGLVDAVTASAWDLVVLLAVIVVLALGSLALTYSQRQPTSLRSDLSMAITDRARLSGEPVDQMLDRAVATYLVALNPTGFADEDQEHGTRAG
jgi:hypothetical protein